jgi:magnesium transporter
MSDLREVIALSFFVPIVMAMGGNTGIQSSTLVIRSLALGSLEGRKVLRLLGREIMAGAVMGLFCSVIIGVWANFFITHSQGAPSPYPAFFLAGTVGLALLCAMTFAAAFGAFVPILLNKFNVDPAVASGPFVTSSNDIFALLIYYGVAVSLVTVYYYSSGAAV